MFDKQAIFYLAKLFNKYKDLLLFISQRFTNSFYIVLNCTLFDKEIKNFQAKKKRRGETERRKNGKALLNVWFITLFIKIYCEQEKKNWKHFTTFDVVCDAFFSTLLTVFDIKVHTLHTHTLSMHYCNYDESSDLTRQMRM